MATPMTYEFSLTGVCDNTGNGAVSISVSGGTSPYTVDNTIPGSLSSQTGTGPFLFSGLTADTYVFRVNDSLGDVNAEFFINANVSGCFCANIENATGTTCGNVNGQLTVENTSNSSPYVYQLYKNGSPEGSSINTNYTSYTYSNLSSGIYSVLVTDYGGATAFTESAVIEESETLDFGYYVIPESPCTPGFGSATVTGQTGQSPYTYIWSNGQTGSTATGLTTGSVSVEVTDSVGCVRQKNIIIPIADPLGVVSSTPTNASCFNCDGDLLVTISGGTPPYTYNGSNGQVHTTNQTSYLLTGLCNGGYTVIVNDVAGCTTSTSEIINSTAGFDIVSINTTNSTCGQSGEIEINIVGPQNIFTYSIEDNTGSIQSVTTSQQSHTFTNLSSGTYTVTIEANNGSCVYTTQKTIVSSQKYTVSLSTTGATCGNSTGSVEISVNPGTQSISYPIDYVITNINTGQVDYQNLNTSINPELVTNLSVGTYEVSVTDNDGCENVGVFNITQTNGVLMNVSKTNCVLGDDGTATVNIYDGTPPFTVLWSNGESTLSIDNLSADTYTVQVTDANGCTNNGSATITCENKNISSYEVVTICEKDFTTTVGAERDFLSMVNEAYLDISSGETNCVLNEAVYCLTYGFTGETWTSGGTVCYYTGTTLTDVPTEQQWISAIENVLNSINEITNFSINGNTNELSIQLDCEESGTKFELISRVELDLSCDPSVTPTPTPTITSSPTPTPTITSSVTPTPTITPSSEETTYTLTLNLTVDVCAKGGITLIKNGTQSLFSYFHNSGTPGLINQVYTFSGLLGSDVITVDATAAVPTTSGCALSTTETDVFNGITPIIDIDSSGGFASQSHVVGSPSSNITITADILSV